MQTNWAMVPLGLRAIACREPGSMPVGVLVRVALGWNVANVAVRIAGAIV